jgi:hypothetical protein
VVKGSFLLMLMIVQGVASSPAIAAPRELDRSFGDNGTVVTGFGNGDALGSGVALLPSGKIVIGGLSGQSRATLAVYRPNGALDRSFGDNGKVIQNGYSEWGGVAVDDYGRIPSQGRNSDAMAAPSSSHA